MTCSTHVLTREDYNRWLGRIHHRWGRCRMDEASRTQRCNFLTQDYQHLRGEFVQASRTEYVRARRTYSHVIRHLLPVAKESL